MQSVNYTEVLDALRDFTARERISFLPSGAAPAPLSPYAPITKYVLDLKNGAKPESAAEDLFTALCLDVLGFQPTRQVGVAEGYVDFMLPERMGDPIQLELKPLFLRDGPDALWRSDANPKHHVAQVKKYLRDHEYLTLTDLRTAWFFSAPRFLLREPALRLHAVRGLSGALPRNPQRPRHPPPRRGHRRKNPSWSTNSLKTSRSGTANSPRSNGLLPNRRRSLSFSSSTSSSSPAPSRISDLSNIISSRMNSPALPNYGSPRARIASFPSSSISLRNSSMSTTTPRFFPSAFGAPGQRPGHLKRFCDKLNFVLGINLWDQAFSRGIVHYNYPPH